MMTKPEEKKGKEQITFQIPAEGSLGLLALGAVGLKAWRKKRDEERLKINSEKKDE